MKVAVYCRVSSDEQREKQSIETQVDFARRYCALHEMEIVEWYKDDGVSGGVPCVKRPAGAQMLADARAHNFDMLLVYRVTRLSRGLRDLLNVVDMLEGTGVAFCSMTEAIDTTTPSGRLTLQMLGSLGEFEKESNREHSIEGCRKRARDSQWLGGLSPLGYKTKDGKLAVDPTEAAIVERIFTMCADDRMSLGEIADLLNAEGVLSRNAAREKGRASTSGKGWQRGTLSKILHNETYLGRNAYNKRKAIRKGGEVIGRVWTEPSEHIVRDAPPIISPELFARAGAALKVITDSPANAKRLYLLRGLIKCGLCGCKYCGCWPSDRNVFYYKCTQYLEGGKGKRCQSATIRGDQLEAEVWNDIQEFARNPGKVMEKLRAQVQAQKNALAPVQVEQEIITGKIQDKQTERQRVIGLVRRASISDSEADAELASLQRDMDALEKQLTSLTKRMARSQELQAKLADADAVLHKLALAVEGATEQTKREIIEMLVLGITAETVVENGKKVARMDVTYAFESAPQRLERIREVVSGLV